MRLLITFLVLLSLTVTIYGQEKKSIDFNTALFESTFLIKEGDKNGTAFILARDGKQIPDFYYVLITAAHVLNAMGKEATLVLRQKEKDVYKNIDHKIVIRDDKGLPLWKTSPTTADVAVMYVKLPFDLPIAIFTDLLATDEKMEEYEIHPGDNLSVLGYPLGVTSPIAVFPVLRSAKIASYPLTPSKDIKNYFIDFQVYGGNSGGPVYLSESTRFYKEAIHAQRINLITGLISEQVGKQIVDQQGKPAGFFPVFLAIVIPSQFILDAINQLPDKPTN